MDTITREAEAFDAESRAKALKRAQDERDRIMAEREEHAATVARENGDRRAELDLVLEALKEPERRQVRLHAYLHVLNSDWGTPTNLQEHVDGQTLRLARYMVEGKV
jgi:hypothetical protein